jgi:hypothetical protein
MPKPLGKQQKDLLDCLERRGYWDKGLNCGWTWIGVKTTIRILDSLVKRGLVKTDGYRYESVKQ